jgi:hypothetical protein
MLTSGHRCASTSTRQELEVVGTVVIVAAHRVVSSSDVPVDPAVGRLDDLPACDDRPAPFAEAVPSA